MTDGPNVTPDRAAEAPPLERRPGRPLAGWLAIALVVGTSAAVLVLEILASRLLAPYVGASLETYTGIIGTVLAGIALGAWAGGALADVIDPRRILPVLLVAGGAASLATIPIVRALGDAFGIGGPGALMLTFLGFLPSATILSAVPPAVIKLQLDDLASTGSVVGRLSAYGTGGAIVGTFLTGYVLVTVAAVSTLIVAVALILIASGIALFVGFALAARRRRSAALDAAAGADARTDAGGEPPERPTAFGVSLGVAALAGLGAATIAGPCEVQTAYYCVAVDRLDNGDAVLVLDDLRHSYVSPDEPAALGFWYTRRFADAIDVHLGSRPLEAVHIGGGALTMPAWVEATRPGSSQLVAEIDADLLDVVADRFGRAAGPTDGGGYIETVAGDARITVGDLGDDSSDIVVGDAFGSRAVPWHLATQEFTLEVQRVLRPDGVYVLNVIDGPDANFLRSQLATVSSVFEHVLVTRSAAAAQGFGGNAVIVAADRPLDADALRSLVEADTGSRTDGKAGELIADLTTFVGDADILTDDFAPVDQLIASS